MSYSLQYWELLVYTGTGGSGPNSACAASDTRHTCTVL
jgi:hypothetical protein